MTIKFAGHVVSVGIGHKNRIQLVLATESEACGDDIKVEASRGETDAYRPGMPVEFTIIPRPDLETAGVRMSPQSKVTILQEAAARALKALEGSELDRAGREAREALRMTLQSVA